MKIDAKWGGGEGGGAKGGGRGSVQSLGNWEGKSAKLLTGTFNNNNIQLSCVHQHPKRSHDIVT